MEVKSLQKIWSAVEKYGNVSLRVNISARDKTMLAKNFKMTPEPFGFTKFEFK